MTTAIGPIITTSPQSLETLKTLNCTVDTIVKTIAVVILRANSEMKKESAFETVAVLDGKFKVTLPGMRIKATMSCKDCDSKIAAPGVYAIQNITTGQTFSFDEFCLHKMLAHHNFDICAWDENVGKIDLTKACAVLELA